MFPITYTHNGIKYEAEYFFISDDEIMVHLPDGPRHTWLRGLDAEDAAQRHLVAYAKNQKKSGSATK